MKTFTLFGKKVDIPDELSNFNIFRDKYVELAQNASKEFGDKYKRFSSIEDVFNGYDAVCGELLEPIFDAAVSDLLANKVYDIDKRRIFDALCQQYGEKGMLKTDIAMEGIKDKFEDIIEDQQAKENYRRARRQGRGRVGWIGFGVEGAVKGAVQAGVINAGTGIAHGAVNMVGNAFSAIGAGIKKIALFNNSSTFDSLDKAFYRDCINILFVLVGILEKNGMRIKSQTTDEVNRAKVLFDNISNPGFPRGEVLNALIQSILLDPYEDTGYLMLIDRFGDKNNEVERLAAYFHVDVAAYKENIIQEYFKKLPLATLEDVLAARKSIAGMCAIGGVPNTIHTEIERLLEDRKYDRLYEKYSGFPKNTLDEWYACREKIGLLSKELEVSDNGKEIIEEIDAEIIKFKCRLAGKFLSKLPKTSEDEAVEAKKRLEKYCDEIELSHKNPVMQKINGIIRQIDKDIRTVEGYVFDSREKSKKAVVEKAAIDALLEGRTPVSRKDYQFLLEYLDNNKITPELDRIYRDKYNNAIERISKLTKRALAYQHRSTSRFMLFAGNKKEAWNELTHNGRYELAVILGEEISILPDKQDLREKKKKKEKRTNKPESETVADENKPMDDNLKKADDDNLEKAGIGSVNEVTVPEETSTNQIQQEHINADIAKDSISPSPVPEYQNDQQIMEKYYKYAKYKKPGKINWFLFIIICIPLGFFLSGIIALIVAVIMDEVMTGMGFREYGLLIIVEVIVEEAMTDGIYGIFGLVVFASTILAPILGSLLLKRRIKKSSEKRQLYVDAMNRKLRQEGLSTFCHNCGSKSVDGAEFCQKCGAKLIVDGALQQTPASKPEPGGVGSLG
ncbi:MAG: zinc ribbon domain-containing protein [Treponema sp.]|jgi:hypothetical protein|nr:zinc ribbon domain-containing protein [Treponema sp.]